MSLFQKKGRSIQPAKYGKEFYQYINEPLGILEYSISLIKEKSDHINGPIDIGCIPTLLGNLLSEALELCHEKDSLATTGIYHGMFIGVVQGVSSDEYNISLCSTVDDMPDLIFTPITYQGLIVIIQNNYPLANHNATYLSDLNGYRLTTYRDTILIGKVVYKLLKKKGMETVCSYDDEVSIAGRISSSSKVAVMVDTPFLRQFNSLSKVRLLDVPEDTRMIYMVCSSRNFITSAMEAFANFMVVHCLDMLEQGSLTPAA